MGLAESDFLSLFPAKPILGQKVRFREGADLYYTAIPLVNWVGLAESDFSKPDPGKPHYAASGKSQIPRGVAIYKVCNIN